MSTTAPCLPCCVRRDKERRREEERRRSKGVARFVIRKNEYIVRKLTAEIYSRWMVKIKNKKKS